ncbi:hypothetical protein HGRIS_002176 [Hohenbuehelia grisea]|uniref:NADP-dependent oxidoreductase domain-containing protein n=1 Tax=Hohenbuehelia grisea TaxID=104357 RepID=A0ABR3JJQ7_9AGAR
MGYVLWVEGIVTLTYPHVLLNFRCWMGEVGGGDRVFQMCTKALKHGYRHFDTASGYGNEKEVGEAIKASGIPRDEIYVTTKLPNTAHHKVQEAFEESLANLDCGYVDLYLMHWPQASIEDSSGNVKVLGPEEHPTIVDTWKAMEKLLETGKVKTIGVSNFSIKTLTQLLPHCTVIPATNQVELQPCLPQDDLKVFCESKGILLTAYSPLGRSSTLLQDPIVTSISDALNITPAQVVLSWGVQRGTIVVPKSEDNERMKANLELVELGDEHMTPLSKLHLQPGQHKSLLKYHNTDPGRIFGWTYEDMGWNMLPGGIVPPA